jgi:hypothetical protein
MQFLLQEELPFSAHDAVYLPDFADFEEIMVEGRLVVYRETLKSVLPHHLPRFQVRGRPEKPGHSRATASDVDSELPRLDSGDMNEVKPAIPGEPFAPGPFLPGQGDFRENGYGAPAWTTAMCRYMAISLFHGCCQGCQNSKFITRRRDYEHIDAENPVPVQMAYVFPKAPR